MKWKYTWIAALILPALCSSPSYPQQAPAAAQSTDQAPADAAPAAPATQDLLAGPISNEDDLRRALTGKQIFIRGLWLGEDLHFNMYGDLVGGAPKGSFTLCAVEIEHVRVTKKRLELEGVRYGIHFADAVNWGDQSTSFDYLRVTPKKKHQVIVIDRQQVITPKKKKEAAKPAAGAAKAGAPATPVAPAVAAANTEDASPAETNAAANPAPEARPAADSEEQGKGTQGPTTTDPRKAADLLRGAINRIFAPALDGNMIAQMPDYWQYFYKAQMDHHSLEPSDPNIVRPGPGIDGPKLVKNLVATSNDYAQRAQVAGVASYKVILDPAGKPIGVAVYRPIGFGLDESAVDAIRKSSFSGATKDGKPVSSVVDMAVNFRIYSKRTAPPPPGATQQAADAAGQNISPITGKPSLPGPYTAQAFRDSPSTQDQQAPQQPPAAPQS
jgi:TonB family protein